jgi:hypothetical protein
MIGRFGHIFESTAEGECRSVTKTLEPMFEQKIAA